MNDAPDPLEVELASLAPVELSSELRHRIGERLGDSSPSPARGDGAKTDKRRRLFRQMIVTGGLAAACLLATIPWWNDRRPPVVPPQYDDPETQPITAETGQRTLLTYHHALSLPPDDLDAEVSTYSWPLAEPAPTGVATAIPRELLE